MKKVYFAFAAMSLLVFTACNSKQGAYTEQEKDSLDMVDTTGREDRFNSLMEAADSSATVEKPVEEQSKAVTPSAEPSAEEKKMIK